jgi:hypothetical protein
MYGRHIIDNTHLPDLSRKVHIGWLQSFIRDWLQAGTSGDGQENAAQTNDIEVLFHKLFFLANKSNKKGGDSIHRLSLFFYYMPRP